MNYHTCPACKEAYTTQTKCPRCGHKSKKALLSFAQYKKLGNTVSKEEYIRYCVLFDYAEAGIIQSLELQLKFEIVPQTKVKKVPAWYTAYTQARVTYSPDFRYVYKGITVYEEYKRISIKKRKPLKPYMTAASRNSIKAFIASEPAFSAGNAVFVFTSWHKAHGIYYAFNGNMKQFEYPLANYVVRQEAA